MPRIRGRIFSKGFLASALVSISEIIFSVAKYCMVILPFEMCSLIMLNLISRCLVRLELAGLLIIAIVDKLS